MAFGAPVGMAPPLGPPGLAPGPEALGPPPMGVPQLGPEAPLDAGVGVEQGAPSPDDMMGMLLEAVIGKWGESEMMVDTEKQMLIETLMQIVQPQPEVGPADFAEPGLAPGPEGFGPPPQAGGMGPGY